jgi:hypothetical protein
VHRRKEWSLTAEKKCPAVQNWHGEKGTPSENIRPRTRLIKKPGEHECSEGDYGRARKTEKEQGT